MIFILSLFACSSDKDSGDSDDSNTNVDCVDIDLGSAVGEAVQTGSISRGQGSYGVCGQQGLSFMSDSGGELESSGNEVLLSWTAPGSSTYTVYTYGSDYDTTLTVLDGCGGSSLDCDDDGGVNLDSVVTFSANAGQTYVIILDSYSSQDFGNWTLNIVEGSSPDIYSDTGWHDSGWVVEDDIWGCDVTEWGLCYDMSAYSGWNMAIAQETCAAVATAYTVQTTFIQDNFGCSFNDVVGECELPSSGDFANPVTAFYKQSSFDSATAEAACIDANGDFYSN